jgi:mono/diheme cytochrome c family protein
MVVQKDSNTPPLSRIFVFGVGFGVTLVLAGLVWVYVPQKSDSQTEKIKFGNSSENENTESPVAIAAESSFPELKPEESYARYCSQCHGADGKGDTPLSRMAGVKPTNLVSGPYKYARTVEGVTTLIQKGNGNSMPGFGRELGEANSKTLAQYALNFATEGAAKATSP